ncbi:MAG: TonB-dependent receptor, partial [Acidobacteria bacterium]|nr:TonB-dependent receptor [Acidobacteriota bacterium]
MVRGFSWRVVGIVFLALVAVGFAGAVLAQEAGQQAPAQQEQQPPPEEQAEPTGQFVGEVVVTAQKRPEDIQEVPIAVSTLSGQDLGVILTAGPDVRALSARVPSLMLESSFGRAFPRFYMRGLGNTDFDLNASQPVSMVVDEVVLENPVVKGMPLFDLDRIEVLRGPQGT